MEKNICKSNAGQQIVVHFLSIRWQSSLPFSTMYSHLYSTKEVEKGNGVLFHFVY